VRLFVDLVSINQGVIPESRCNGSSSIDVKCYRPSASLAFYLTSQRRVFLHKACVCESYVTQELHSPKSQKRNSKKTLVESSSVIFIHLD